MDPSTPEGYTYLTISELLNRWHDINLTSTDPRKEIDLHLGIILGSMPHRSLPFIFHRRIIHLD